MQPTFIWNDMKFANSHISEICEFSNANWAPEFAGLAIREFQKTFVPIFVNLPPESMIPTANLLPVSNLPLVSMTPVEKMDPRCQRRHWWCTLSCEYFRKSLKKFQMALMGSSGAWEKLIHEKTWSQKSHGTVLLNFLLHIQNCT